MTEDRRRGGDPLQDISCGVPLGDRRLRAVDKLPAAKALGASGISAQKREVAAVHQHDSARHDAVDLLAQRRVLPFDRRNGSGRSIEQHSGDLAPARAILFAIERANLEDQPSTLKGRQLQAAQQRPGAIAGEAPMETLKAMQPCAEIAIERKQERAAMRGGAADEPESMTPVRIVDQEMTAVIRIDARRDRQERVAVDGMRIRRTFRRLRNDDNGRRMLRPPQGGRLPCRRLGGMRERSTPIGARGAPCRHRAPVNRTRCDVAYFGSLQHRQDFVEETQRQTDLDRVA